MSLEQKKLINQFISEFGFDPFAQQDAQAAPDIGELYAQGWINGGQVQSLIDWCSSYCKKHPSVAFTEGTTRQLAYAIFAALLFYQSEELKFAVNRLKQLVRLVYRGDYSNTETKEWWSQVEEILKDTQAFCALPGEHIQKCAPNTAAATPPAQRVMLTDDELLERLASASPEQLDAWLAAARQSEARKQRVMLTDEELYACGKGLVWPLDEDSNNFARTVIEAYEAKNGSKP